MSATLLDLGRRPEADVRQQLRRSRRGEVLAYGAVLATALCCAAIAWTTVPGLFGIALVLLLALFGCWLVNPYLGLCLTLFFVLVGDASTLPWYPFNKNLSSRESVLYVADALTLSPFEITLAFGVLVAVLRHLASRAEPVRWGLLARPLAVFTFFLVFGFVKGVGSGGDIRAAIWESRPIFYIPVVYLLTINVCRTRRQLRRLVWTAMAGVFVQSSLSLQYFTSLPPAEKAELESLIDHGASLHINVLVVLLAAAWLFRGSSLRARLAPLAALPVVGIVYLISQRRAGFVALLIGLAVVMVALAWEQPRTFWKVAPVGAVLLAGYTAAFWNTTGGVGFAAQAIKSAIAPESISASDQSSDLYRIIENYDVHFTIRQSPLTGFGFGQQFLRPVPLPDISFFEFWQYIPHNSFLWIWIKLGFGGFCTVLYLYGRSLHLAARTLRAPMATADRIVLLACVAYIPMYAVFSYVDISWDTRATVFLGVAFAAVAMHHLDDRRTRPAAAAPTTASPPTGSTATAELPAAVGAP